MKLNIFIALAFATILSSCNSYNTQKAFDYGKIENGKYSNSYFGLEIEVPTDWVVQSKEETDNLTQMGKDIITSDNDQLKALIDASEINTANLLIVFKYEVGSAVMYNPNFVCLAENLKNAPGIKNGSDYLFHSRNLLKQTNLNYTHIDETSTKKTINNHDFYYMNVTLDVMGQPVQQVFYATIINNFCLCAITSYNDDEQRDELEKIVNSITIKG